MLFWLLTTIYILYPSSLPLQLSGIPLNTRSELLLLYALIIWGLFRFLGWFCESVGLLSKPPSKSPFIGKLQGMALALVSILIIGKMFFPFEGHLKACYTVPQISPDRCAWLADNLLFEKSPNLSRYEPELLFNESQGRPWNLNVFNDVKLFNALLTDSKNPKTDARAKALLKNSANPFSAEFRLSSEMIRLIRKKTNPEHSLPFSIHYNGAVEISTASQQIIRPDFSKSEKHVNFSIPNDELKSLSIRYRNYHCEDPSQTSLTACVKELAVYSLPHAKSLFKTEIRWNGKSFPLSYSHLLRKSHPFSIPRILNTIEVLFLCLWSLILLAPFSGAVKWWELFRTQELSLKITVMIAIGAVLSYAVTHLAYQSFFDLNYLSNGARMRRLIPLGSLSLFLVIIALASTKIRETLIRQKYSLGRGILLIFVLPALLVSLNMITNLAPLEDNFIWFKSGDDNRTYAYEAKHQLEHGETSSKYQLPLFYASKPFFIQWRKLSYLLLGGGELYYSMLTTTCYLVLWLCILASLPLIVLKNTFSHKIGRWQSILLTLFLYSFFIIFSHEFLHYGATFAGMAFSEGPAWWWATWGTLLLILVLQQNPPNKRILFMAVLFFTCSALFRSQYLMYLPLIAAAIYALSDTSFIGVLKITGVPLLLIGTLISAHVLMQDFSEEQIKFYAGVATPMGSTGYSMDLLTKRLTKLIPSVREAFGLLLIGISFILWLSKKRSSRYRFGWLFATILGTLFGLNFPFVANSGYYPRHIILSYFIISLVAMGTVLIQVGRKRTGELS